MTRPESKRSMKLVETDVASPLGLLLCARIVAAS